MKAVFLSDAHLTGSADPAQGLLIRFFDLLRGRGAIGGEAAPGESIVVDRLVIVGDFFDFWFAKGDLVYPGFRSVIDRLAALSHEGVTISFCEGNHDFSLGGYFAGRQGFEVYPERAEFSLDGRRFLVSHGDTVDRGNRRYLALRAFLRSSPIRGLVRMLPLKFLWRAARLSSEMSKEMSDESSGRLAEIMHRCARDKFREGYDAVIFGHCHKPLLRQEVSDGRQKTSVTLGDWVTHHSYLRYDDGRFVLERFHPGG
ncbi:MAG: UDP-2,3-diacylglucosamine diphosphatase [Syntrophales bacterium]